MKTYGKVAHIVAAVAALGVSGITLAKHEPGHSNGKGPKSSIEITNTCTLDVDNDTMYGIPDHKLKVVTDIKDASDDNSEDYQIKMKGAQGHQLVKSTTPPKKANWDPLGRTTLTKNTDEQLIFEIHLCDRENDPLEPEVTALNATVQVMTENGANVESRCDDNETTEDVDESIVVPEDSDGNPISCDAR
jgi:hypothetical protein